MAGIYIDIVVVLETYFCEAKKVRRSKAEGRSDILPQNTFNSAVQPNFLCLLYAANK